MKNDSEILKWYYRGYSENLYEEIEIDDDLCLKAHNLGVLHATIDDELKFIYQISNEDILKIVKM